MTIARRTLSCLATLTVLIGLWSCGKLQSQSAALSVPTPELPKLTIELLPQGRLALSPTQLKLLDSNDPGSDQETLFEAFGERLLAKTALNKKQARAAWTKLKARLSQLSAENDPHALKLQIESKVASDHPLQYEREQRDPLHIMESLLLQCDSGTQLYELGRLKAGPSTGIYPVVIAREGHVLPGYVKWSGTEWELFGVEMTVIGRGRIQFGATSQLDSTQQGAMRILYADYYLGFSIFESQMLDTNAYLERALEATARAFSISRAAIEPKGQAPGAHAFYFGDSQTPPGVHPRTQQDDLNSRPQPTTSGSGSISMNTSAISSSDFPLIKVEIAENDFSTIFLRPLSPRARKIPLQTFLEETCGEKGMSFFSGFQGNPYLTTEWYERSPDQRLILWGEETGYIANQFGKSVQSESNAWKGLQWRPATALIFCKMRR